MQSDLEMPNVAVRLTLTNLDSMADFQKTENKLLQF